MSTARCPQNLLSDFIAACERQCALYERLLVCFDKKERAIREARMERLQQISTAEIALLRELRTVDLRRRQQFDALLREEKSERSRVSAAGDALERLDDVQREQVQPIITRMKHAAERVRTRSAVLRSAAESLSAHLSGIVRSAWGLMEQNTVYERSGRVAAGGANLGIDVTS